MACSPNRLNPPNPSRKDLYSRNLGHTRANLATTKSHSPIKIGTIKTITEVLNNTSRTLPRSLMHLMITMRTPSGTTSILRKRLAISSEEKSLKKSNYDKISRNRRQDGAERPLQERLPQLMRRMNSMLCLKKQEVMVRTRQKKLALKTLLKRKSKKRSQQKRSQEERLWKKFLRKFPKTSKI